MQRDRNKLDGNGMEIIHWDTLLKHNSILGLALEIEGCFFA